MFTQLPVLQQTPISSEVPDAGIEFSIGVLAYFRGRLSNRVHELVLSEFAAQEREGKINRAELARRIGRKPEQITRWLGTSGNWTLETLSDLLLGMGLEPALSVQSVANPSPAWPSSWPVIYFDAHTAQEVAQDIASGNHKQVYLSFSKQENYFGVTTIELQPQSAFNQPMINIKISNREKVYDNN